MLMLASLEHNITPIAAPSKPSAVAQNRPWMVTLKTGHVEERIASRTLKTKLCRLLTANQQSRTEQERTRYLGEPPRSS